MLAALRLTLHHDAGRQVCKAHGSLDLIDVLSPVASCAEGVNLKFLRTNVDFDAVVDFGDYKNGSERCMAARGLVEWRNTDEPVHSSFGGKQAVCIFSLDAHGYGFEPGAFAGLRIDHGSVETFALTPAQVHAQEHLCPILRFRAARSGLYGENGVEAVAFAREQGRGLELCDVLVGRVELLFYILKHGFALRDVVLLVRHVQISFDVARNAR